VGCLWRFVLMDAVAGADVGEYSAPLPALVHVYPPPLPPIVITPPFPSLRVHRANVPLLRRRLLSFAASNAVIGLFEDDLKEFR
jgi:hypothetical protein